MPGGDRTGPLGEGPLTGRRAGYCAGNDAPGFTEPWTGRGQGGGFGAGRGGGFGSGGGFGRGRGGAWRHGGWRRGFAWPWDRARDPGAPAAITPQTAVETPDAKPSLLERLAGELADIRARLARLEGGGPDAQR
jgi:hypothetical protein